MSKMTTFGFVILLTISLAKRGWVDAISCYQCGVDTNNKDSCEKPPQNYNFIADCTSGDICSKTVPRPRSWQHGDVEGKGTNRGCSRPTSNFNKRHELGCYTDQWTGTVMCFCDTNLCNKASIAHLSTAILMFTIGLFIVMTISRRFVHC